MNSSFLKLEKIYIFVPKEILCEQNQTKRNNNTSILKHKKKKTLFILFLWTPVLYISLCCFIPTVNNDQGNGIHTLIFTCISIRMVWSLRGGRLEQQGPAGREIKHKSQQVQIKKKEMWEQKGNKIQAKWGITVPVACKSKHHLVFTHHAV